MWFLKLVYFLLLALIASAISSAGQHPPDFRSRVELCDLQDKPQEFLNKTFDVRGEYVAGFEMGWFKSVRTCDIETPKAILYLFDNDFERATGKRNYRRLERKLKIRSGESSPRSVVGNFRIRVEPYAPKHETDRRFDYQFRILAALSID
mgnify:CR=1 FL=1